MMKKYVLSMLALLIAACLMLPAMTLAEAAYTITDAGEGLVDVTVDGTIDAAAYAEMMTACAGKSIHCLYISESGALNCPDTAIAAATVENRGVISGGSFSGAVLHNYAAVDGDCAIYDVVNYEGATISGSYEWEDGDCYYDTYLYGEIENYGAISSVGYSGASVKVNEGTIQVDVHYNSGWDWDDGWGWESETKTFNYGDRVGDVLGEGFYTVSGEYAADMTLGLNNSLYHHWTRSASGSITVKAASQFSNVHITAEMAGEAGAIAVSMGILTTDELSIPVYLSNVLCESETHYYTSGLGGGVFNGDITVNEEASIKASTINGTLRLKDHCAVDSTTVFGSKAKVIVEGELGEVSNIWKPYGYPYTYNMPLTIAEGASVTVASTFNGDVVNYGTIANGRYYGTVTNYGTITGGTLYGNLVDFGPHEHAPGAGGDSVSWTRWDGSSALSMSSGDNYVALACDTSISSGITVNSGEHLHLCLAGNDLTRTTNGAVITINEDGTLSLCDCSSSYQWGKVTTTSSNGRGVNINSGTMYMYSGKVADNVYGSDGAGVMVYSGALFEMHGGEISGNSDGGKNWIHGAGVMCDYNSTFIMYGGKICGNAAERGAGVRVSSGSSMYMHGGEISGNTANNIGGGIYSPGSNVTIEITGGTITGNTASEGGAIYNNASPLSSTAIRMSGGSIIGNTAATAAGGLNGPIALSGSAAISGNTLTSGTKSNLCSGSSMISLSGDFSGNVYVSPTAPASGSYTAFLERADGELTPSDLSFFHPDSTSYALYIGESGKGVLGQKTYTLSLTNAQTVEGKTYASIAPGTELTVSAVIPEGKVFVQWENAAGDVLDVKETSFTTVMPIGDLRLSAILVDEFVITDGVLTAYNGEDKALITIPDSVTSIAEGVFDHCAQLEAVILPSAMSSGFVDTFPAGVDKFFAYENSTGYTLTKYLGEKTDVVLPACVTRIEYSSFPSGVISVAGPAATYAVFNNHDTIERISLPVIEEIPAYALSDLTKLSQVDLPMAKTIGMNAFYDLDSLTEISLPAAESIADYAFGSCDNLANVSIPNVTSIGVDAFSSCASLVEFSAPELTAMGEGAFENCPALERIFLPKLKDISKDAFSACTKLTTFEHDLSSPYTIAAQAFNLCVRMTEIDLTNATSIGLGAFVGCKLDPILVPDTVTFIGNSAFDQDVTIRSSVNAYARTWAQENGNPWEHDVHNETVLAAVEVTCTTDGLTEGLWCPDCEAILTAQETIIAPGHATVTDAAVEATCTTDGLTEGSHCETCGEIFAAQEVIPASGHVEITTPGFAATCTEPGLTDDIFCETCGEELQLAQEIPARGHAEMVTIEALAPTCTQDGHTQEISCSVCGDVLTASEEIPALGHAVATDAAVEVTCTTDGLTEGSHCETCGEILIAQEIIPALGHSPVTDAAVEQTDRESGLTEGSHCETCGEVLMAQEVIPANFSWDGDTVIGYNAGNPVVVIPSDADGIGDTAFKNNTFITSVTVPDNVGFLGTQTFYGCTALENVYLPDNLTGIGAQTFYKVTGRVYASIGSATAIALSYRGVPFATEDGYLLRYRVTSAAGTPTAVWVVGYFGGAAALDIPADFGGVPVKEILEGAFEGRTQLTAVTIPTGVTTIGSSAFAGCTGIRSMSIPASVTYIGSGAFYGCSRLTKVTLSGNLTEIPDELFAYCTALKAIEIPAGVTAIGGSALYMCEQLASVSLPEGMETIGGYAFAGCTALSGVVLPKSLTALGDRAFAYCSAMGHIVLPDEITSIGADVNANSGPTLYCSNATTTEQTLMASGCSYSPILTISTVEKADGTYDVVVTDCAQLATEVVVPEGVTKIGRYAFQSCEQMTAIELPATLMSIEQSAFQSCKKLKEIVIPEGVTTIGDGAFQWCYALERIDIPESVYFIGAEAFNSCNVLRDIALPSSLTEIGEGMFNDCGALTSIVIPEGVTTIGRQAFYQCSALASVTIPDSVKSIGESAFALGGALESIYLPGDLEEIGNHAFQTVDELVLPSINCRSAFLLGERGYSFTLEDDRLLTFKAIVDEPGAEWITLVRADQSVEAVSIPEGVTIIGSNAFFACAALERVSIPSGVTDIGDGTFSNCSALTQIEIPDGVTRIGDSVFYDCTSLADIEIPSSVTSIANSAFEQCTALTNVHIPSGVVSIGDRAFWKCTSLKDIEIPASVTSIGKEAFSYCAALKEVDIPDSITSISDNLFASCSSLESVRIPQGVTAIGYGAFSNCESLLVLELPSNILSVGQNAVYSSTRVIVDEADCPTAFAVCSIGKHVRYAVKGSEKISLWAERNENGEASIYVKDADVDITQGVIPQGVTEICDNAFQSCRGMTDVVIPEGVVSIGARAFQLCESLTSVTIPEGMKYIGTSAFCSCYSLKWARLPGNIEGFGDVPFDSVPLYVPTYNCQTAHNLGKVYKQYWPDDYPQLCFRANSDEAGVVTYDLYNVSSSSTEVVVPDWVSSINWLSNGGSLTSITIPDHVTAISDTAFKNAPENMVIRSTLDAYARTWAQEHGYTWEHDVHTEITLDAVAPTCTQDGVAAGVVCEGCGAILSGCEVVAALGHTEAITEAVAPTCTETGLTEGKHCAVCNEILLAQEEIAALGHTEATTEAVAPTCTETGLTEGKHCAVCNEILLAQEEAAALGHTEEERGGYAPTCTEPGMQPDTYCSVCGELLEQGDEIPMMDHSVVIDAAIPPTHATVGLTEGSHCASCGEVYVAQREIPVVDVPVMTLPAALRVIRVQAFENSAFVCVVIPQGCTAIETGAFAGSAQLRFIEIPDTVTQIGEGVFSGCRSDLIIVTAAGSQAQAYAAENGIVCVVK